MSRIAYLSHGNVQVRRTAHQGRRTCHAAVFCVVCVAIGVVLVYSGIEHLKNPYYFLASVMKYRLLDAWSARTLSIILPPFQLLLGISLCLGVMPRTGLTIALIVFLGFAAALQIALLRELRIDCGCFGPGNNQPISQLTVTRTIAMAALCGIALRYCRLRRTSGEMLKCDLQK